MYPYGYGYETTSLDGLRARHEPKMHPEFARRLFPWIESMDGLIGIGGGWRDTQPDRPGFAPNGRSFHQFQDWASGISAYAAVDLVAVTNGGVHRSPTWAESATAPAYGLHTFIKTPPEPWHMQPIEIRGWSTWREQGRPDPDPSFVLPDTPPQEATVQFSYPVVSSTSNPGDLDARRAIARVEALLLKFALQEGLDVPNADGLWSDVTELAVRAFQAKRGLKADGIVGAKTWSELLGTDVV